MTVETIVAVYDTSAHADMAVKDLEKAGLPSSAISKHAKTAPDTSSGTTTTGTSEKPGFWSNLFGSEPEHDNDRSVYSRSLEGGSTAVTVKADEPQLTQAMEILERHNPIDIDERGASYNMTQTTSTTAAPLATRTTDAPSATGTAAVRPANATDGGPIQLAEETLAVGKRAINRGTTRIRRYSVETPVEEHVSLRDETVSVERRPVTDGQPITNPDFADKTMEMTETDEEAVVSKTARVKEEVLLHKEATDRTETVRDTLRRDEVEITKEPGVQRSTDTMTANPAAATPMTSTPAAAKPKV